MGSSGADERPRVPLHQRLPDRPQVGPLHWLQTHARRNIRLAHDARR